MRYLSLCSGIEAASVAWEPLGWTPVAFAEIDPFCRQVLAEHWPGVPNLGDVTAITDERVGALGRIDLVVGGTPCQDLSVAGGRAGLGGDRSILFFDFLRVADAARRLCGARFVLWENVPGAFTSHGGRDFARVVSEFVGIDVAAPRGGWGNEGLALGPRGLLEWGLLDAQWFGLAQRRERVFALLDFGDWQGRRPVLLEPESVRGDSAPRRETGARPAGTLTARALDGSSVCAGDGRENLLQVEVAGPLLSNSHGAGWRTGAEEAASGHLIPEVADPITANEGRTYTHEGRGNFRLHNVVATPVVAAPLTHGGHPNSNTPSRHREDDANLVAEVSGAITSRTAKGPNTNATEAALIACFDGTQVTHAENRSTCAPDTAALARTARPPAVALLDPGVRVRRLTPRECERLMGVPDDFTRIPTGRRRRPAKDTPRYAALGNSIAVGHLRWIGLKLQEVLKWQSENETPKSNCQA